MQTHRNDHLDADVRRIEAVQACFSEACVNEQLDDSNDRDGLMRTLDERKIDYGMSSDRDS